MALVPATAFVLPFRIGRVAPCFSGDISIGKALFQALATLLVCLQAVVCSFMADELISVWPPVEQKILCHQSIPHFFSVRLFLIHLLVAM